MLIFSAQYPGTCIECQAPILIGEWIARAPDEGYVHENCRPTPPDSVCTSCNLAGLLVAGLCPDCREI